MRRVLRDPHCGKGLEQKEMSGRRLPVEALLLIGPTGSGKTPLGEYIGLKGLVGRRCFHFDFGNELREVGVSDAPPPGFTDVEHKFVRDVLEKGLLLEDHHFPLAEKILNLFLGRSGFTPSDLLILNGMPRHAGQAKSIEPHADVSAVVLLECEAEDVYLRIRQDVGGDRAGRTDDAIAMVRKKLEIFRERTLPLLEHYESGKRPVMRIRVAASSTVEDTYDALAARWA